jgi:hypothetical protein
VDILKALARKVSDQHVIAYAIPFVSRPTLQIRSTENGPNNSEIKSFTFTDAIAKYGHLLKQFDLGEAYRRAGSFFKGQLEQNFVVLKERDQHPYQPHLPQPHQQHHQQRSAGRGHHRGRFPEPSGSRKRVRDEEEAEIEDNPDMDWNGETRYVRGSDRGHTSAKRPWRGNRGNRR